MFKKFIKWSGFPLVIFLGFMVLLLSFVIVCSQIGCLPWNYNKITIGQVWLDDDNNPYEPHEQITVLNITNDWVQTQHNILGKRVYNHSFIRTFYTLKKEEPK